MHPYFVKKKNKTKQKQQKRPFISEEEWKELDEEDDEMIFIEEYADND